MRPIKLTIKGLNSFIEEQTIDFDKLTDQGLFGIFGPTGSGKSTILDGITLALYGDIARKSSNYINTNCNDLNVSYEFQISGSVNRIYKVSRQFRRDKKTGTAKTHSASIIEYTAEGPKVLGEGATQVTKTCKEILGLSLEDFTRTVVLPQGKFSEFLKLEGKNRREMLERLFNLQEYGEGLSRKLSREVTAENAHNERLMGELKGYEEISEDKLKESSEQLEESRQKLKALQDQQKKADAQFRESEEIWNLQKEIEGYTLRQKELEGEKAAIAEIQNKADRGESALRVYPTLTAYENTEKNLEIEDNNVTCLVRKAEQLAKSKAELESDFKAAAKEKEERLPELRDKSQLLKTVIEDQASAVQLEQELKKIQAGLQDIAGKTAVFHEQRNQMDHQLEECQTYMTALQQQQQDQYVDELLRSKVQEGLMKTQHYAIEKANAVQNEARITQLHSEKQQLEEQIMASRRQVETASLNVSEKEKQQLQLQEAPVSQEKLMQLQQEVTSLKEKWTRYEWLNQENDKLQQQLTEYGAKEKQLVDQYETQKQRTEEAKAALEKAKMENMVYALSRHLHTGDHCPVCGGIIHKLADEKQDENEALQSLEINLSEEQSRSDKAEKSLNQLRLQQAALQETYQRLRAEEEPLSQLFKAKSLKEAQVQLDEKTEELKEYEKKKKVLDQELTGLKEQKNDYEKTLGQLETSQKEHAKQITALEKESADQNKILAEIGKQLEELKKELDGRAFETISQEIQAKDQKREKLTKQLAEFTKEKDEKQRAREELMEKLSKYRASFERGLAQFDEKQKNKMNVMQRLGNRLKDILAMAGDDRVKEAKQQIVAVIEESSILSSQLKGESQYESVLAAFSSKSGEELKHIGVLAQYPLVGEALRLLEEQMSNMIHLVAQMIEGIEENFQRADKAFAEITEQYDLVSKQLLEARTKLEALKKRLAEEEAIVRESLKEEKLTKEEVKTYLLSREEIESLKHKINDYKEECSRLAGTMENADKKLAGRRLEEAQWLSVQKELEEITEAVTRQHEVFVNLGTAVKNMEQALAKLGELRAEKEKLDHKRAILADLDKLLKGKKFVQFVALARLKYISIEASRRLKEISCGNYGMEVDEEGRFIIRDYKNGGAQRDASTLSGGETFLASLALALALSAQIQLRGTAPLELFFLDEGFGTLDDELLDTVMSSLEKIHHDKLKVGIISHVEAIKNRMPVKLILTPAEAGMGGTKVRLERS